MFNGFIGLTCVELTDCCSGKVIESTTLEMIPAAKKIGTLNLPST
jgi:hypothetical protein